MRRHRVAGAVSSAVFGLTLAAHAEEPAATAAADSNTAVTEGPTSPTTGSSSIPAAQEAAPTVPVSNWYGDVRVVGLIATAFGDNTDGPGFGFDIAVNVGHRHIPLTVGVDVTTVYLGTQTSPTQVRTGDTVVALDRSREDLAYLLDTSLRFAPLDGWFRPYLEGVLGTKLLQTKYSLSFPDSGTSTSAISDHDWTWTAGWGLGLDLGHTAPGGVDFTAGIRRLSGGTASFSRTVNGAGDVARYSAETNYMLYMLGVTGRF